MQAPFFKAHQSYTNAFPQQLKALEMYKNGDARFFEWLEAKERMLNCKLRDLIAMPVQRLPRYVMLLQELKDKTKAEHPDFGDLCKSVDTMRQIADFVNERRREFESLEKTQALAARIAGYQLFENTSASVLHVHDGRVQQLQPEKGDSQLALFSEVLVITRRPSRVQAALAKRDGVQAPLKFRGAVKLYRGQACAPVIDDALQFRVDQSNSSLSPALLFQCASEAERDEWVSAIRKTIDKL